MARIIAGQNDPFFTTVQLDNGQIQLVPKNDQGDFQLPQQQLGAGLGIEALGAIPAEQPSAAPGEAVAPVLPPDPGTFQAPQALGEAPSFDVGGLTPPTAEVPPPVAPDQGLGLPPAGDLALPDLAGLTPRQQQQTLRGAAGSTLSSLQDTLGAREQNILDRSALEQAQSDEIAGVIRQKNEFLEIAAKNEAIAQRNASERIANLRATYMEEMDAAASLRTRPDRVWSSASAGTKIGMMAAVFAGAFNQVKFGGQNVALDQIMDVIDKDIDSQRVAIEQARFKAQAAGQAAQFAVDDASREALNRDKMRGMRLLHLSGQLEAVSAKYQSSILRKNNKEAALALHTKGKELVLGRLAELEKEIGAQVRNQADNATKRHIAAVNAATQLSIERGRAAGAGAAASADPGNTLHPSISAAQHGLNLTIDGKPIELRFKDAAAKTAYVKSQQTNKRAIMDLHKVRFLMEEAEGRGRLETNAAFRGELRRLAAIQFMSVAKQVKEFSGAQVSIQEFDRHIEAQGGDPLKVFSALSDEARDDIMADAQQRALDNITDAANVAAASSGFNRPADVTVIDEVFKEAEEEAISTVSDTVGTDKLPLDVGVSNVTEHFLDPSAPPTASQIEGQNKFVTVSERLFRDRSGEELLNDPNALSMLKLAGLRVGALRRAGRQAEAEALAFPVSVATTRLREAWTRAGASGLQRSERDDQVETILKFNVNPSFDLFTKGLIKLSPKGN